MAGQLGTLNIIRGPAPPATGAWQGSGRRRQRAVFKPVIQQDDDENDAVSEASESSEGSLLDQAIAAQATPQRPTAPFKPPKHVELRESIFGTFSDVSEDEV